jgi:hypothetical protein
MNLKIYLRGALSAALTILLAAMASAAEKRRHDPHVHGVAEVNIAVEGSKADVEFRVPADSVMGFEHEAKTESDRKKRDAALRTVQTKMPQMVVFDSRLGCKISQVKTAVVQENAEPGNAQHSKNAQQQSDQNKTGEHREVQAEFSVACQKPLAGSRVTFGVSKVFPEIHEIKVQVLGDAKQSGATIEKDKGDVRL